MKVGVCHECGKWSHMLDAERYAPALLACPDCLRAARVADTPATPLGPTPPVVYGWRAARHELVAMAKFLAVYVPLMAVLYAILAWTFGVRLGIN